MSSAKSCDSKGSFEVPAVRREPRRHHLVVEEALAAHSSGSCKNVESPAAECDEDAAEGHTEPKASKAEASKPHKAMWLERYQQDQEGMEVAAHGAAVVKVGCEPECSSPVSRGMDVMVHNTVWLQPLKQRMKGMLMQGQEEDVGACREGMLMPGRRN